MGGGYPSQVWMVGGGTPARSLCGGGIPARSGWWGVPWPGLDGGRYPGQVLVVGGTPTRSGWWGYPGYPPLAMSGWWGRFLGYPPYHDWMGHPPTMTGWGTLLPWLNGVPPTMMGYPHPHQHNKHFFRGGQYASCVHAGGLSCFHAVFRKKIQIWCWHPLWGWHPLLWEILGPQLVKHPTLTVYRK